jgi:hypothetical protein
MKRKRYTDEQIAFAAISGKRDGGGGDLPQDGRLRTDFLPVEEAVPPAWAWSRSSR